MAGDTPGRKGGDEHCQGVDRQIHARPDLGAGGAVILCQQIFQLEVHEGTDCRIKKDKQPDTQQVGAAHELGEARQGVAADIVKIPLSGALRLVVQVTVLGPLQQGNDWQ